jgi:hypothetical protein
MVARRGQVGGGGLDGREEAQGGHGVLLAAGARTGGGAGRAPPAGHRGGAWQAIATSAQEGLACEEAVLQLR